MAGRWIGSKIQHSFYTCQSQSIFFRSECVSHSTKNCHFHWFHFPWGCTKCCKQLPLGLNCVWWGSQTLCLWLWQQTVFVATLQSSTSSLRTMWTHFVAYRYTAQRESRHLQETTPIAWWRYLRNRWNCVHTSKGATIQRHQQVLHSQIERGYERLARQAAL